MRSRDELNADNGMIRHRPRPKRSESLFFEENTQTCRSTKQNGDATEIYPTSAKILQRRACIKMYRKINPLGVKGLRKLVILR